MNILGESPDSFGIPLFEDRPHQHVLMRAEDARDQLERARAEVGRALDHLREIQKDTDSSGRGGSEIKSAINACIECERELVNALHKAENVVHRVRKTKSTKEESSPTEGHLTEQEVFVEFEHKGKNLVACYDVEGEMESDGSGGAQWKKQPKPHLVGISEESNPQYQIDAVTFDPKLIEKLEDQAIKKYASWFQENKLKNS